MAIAVLMPVSIISSLVENVIPHRVKFVQLVILKPLPTRWRATRCRHELHMLVSQAYNALTDEYGIANCQSGCPKLKVRMSPVIGGSGRGDLNQLSTSTSRRATRGRNDPRKWHIYENIKANSASITVWYLINLHTNILAVFPSRLIVCSQFCCVALPRRLSSNATR